MDFDNIIRLMSNLFWVNMHSSKIVLAKTGYERDYRSRKGEFAGVMGRELDRARLL